MTRIESEYRRTDVFKRLRERFPSLFECADLCFSFRSAQLHPRDLSVLQSIVEVISGRTVTEQAENEPLSFLENSNMLDLRNHQHPTRQGEVTGLTTVTVDLPSAKESRSCVFESVARRLALTLS